MQTAKVSTYTSTNQHHSGEGFAKWGITVWIDGDKPEARLSVFSFPE